MKKNFLVTGGAGYIGSMLVTELIKQGHQVTVIDKLIYNNNSLSHLFCNKKFSLIAEDVNNKKLIKKLASNVEIIIPLAALVGAPLCEKNPTEAKNVNYKSIKYLMSIIKKNQKIIFPTTNSGYGIGQKNKFCNEETPLNPISLYGRTKVDAEKLVLGFKNSISLRLATVFGVSYRMRTDLLVNNFVEKAYTQKKISLFEPNFRRNYIHVKDVVKAFIFAINNFKSMKGKVYNVGLSKANLTKIELVIKIKKKIKDLKISILKNKKDPDKRDYFVSNKRIEKLGYRADYLIEDGILELIQFFKFCSNKDITNNY